MKKTRNKRTTGEVTNRIKRKEINERESKKIKLQNEKEVKRKKQIQIEAKLK